MNSKFICTDCQTNINDSNSLSDIDLFYTSGWPKNGTIVLYALTLPDINRFSKLFQCRNQGKICISKDPTIHLKCVVNDWGKLSPRFIDRATGHVASPA